MANSRAVQSVLELFAEPPRKSSIPDAVVIALDGRSGAGKTTLSREIIRHKPEMLLVQIEDFYEGWGGLLGAPARLVEQVLAPWAGGKAAEPRTWDWQLMQWHGKSRRWRLDPPRLVLIEGVGSGAVEIAPFLSALVWLELDSELRYSRAMERESEQFGPYWHMWARQEEALLARSCTPQRADLVL